MQTVDFVSTNRSISANFQNKLFALFGLSILGTALGVYAGFQFMDVLFIQNPWSMFLIWGVELALLFSQRLWAYKKPLNFLLFTAFTVLSGLSIVPILLSYIAEFQGFDIIIRALFSTTVLFLAMGLIGWQIQKSLHGFSGFLLMGLITLIVVSIIGIFIPWGSTGEMLVSGAGMMLFAAFALVDVNRLKYFPEEEYISAGIQLYLDMFNLFIYVLRFIGVTSRD